MTYFKQYKESGAEAFEITKEEARHSLEGWWKEEALDDIFDDEKPFRLFTAYCDVWTETDDGMVPVAGFYGVCG